MKQALMTDDQHQRVNLGFKATRDGQSLAVHFAVPMINALNGPPLRDRLKFEIDEGARWITIDLSGVDEIEKAQFGALLSVAKYAKKQQDGAVTIRNAKPHVLAGFKHWGVAQAFTFATSEGTP